MKLNMVKRTVCLWISAALLVAGAPHAAAVEEEGRMGVYDYPIPVQYDKISDREFLGVWDAEGERWSAKSYIDYSYHENLHQVEQAVKEGDYDLAKQLLLNYYIDREQRLGRPKTTISSKLDFLTTELLTKNFFYNAGWVTLIDSLKVTKQPGTTSADVTSYLSGKIGNESKVVFCLIAEEKDGAAAEFVSKEGGENQPYLDLKVNGTRRVIYPTADTYISAGDNANVNHGSEAVLLAEETAIGEEQPVNSDTKRIELMFDISDLKPGDTISAANLTLYGSCTGEQAEKSCVLFGQTETAWKEDTVTWSNMFGKVVYSFDQEEYINWTPPDDAAFRFKEDWFRFNTWWYLLVGAYNTTGDEQYAYTAIRFFMDYVRAHGDRPYHDDPLDPSCRLQIMPEMIPQLVNSEYMTPDIFLIMLKYVWTMAEFAGTVQTATNVGSTATEGMFTAAAYFPEYASAKRWVDRVKERYDELSGGLSHEDGSSPELSIGYANYALSTLLGGWRIAAKLGIEEPYTERTKERMEKVARYIVYAKMPGCRDPQWGDGNPYTQKLLSGTRELAQWLDDPTFYYMSEEGATGRKPDFESIIYPVGRKAVMRKNWLEKDGLYLGFQADGAVGNHGHADDLSFVLYAWGQYLLVDPMYGTYGDAPERKWLLSSIAHNTVTVNGKDQTKAVSPGDFTRWETNEQYDFITGTTPNVVDAEYARDILYVRPGFWIVSDHLEPRNGVENTYVQAWHMLPDAGLTIEEDSRIADTHFDGANLRVVPLDGAEYSRSALVDGLYSSGANSVTDAKYVEYEQKKAGTTVFHTLLLPQNVGEVYQVQSREIALDILPEQAGAFAFCLTDEAENEQLYTYYTLHSESLKKKRPIGQYETDGSLMLVQENRNGVVQSVILQDASVFEKEHTLLESRTPLQEFAVSWGNSSIQIDSSQMEEADLKAVTIYAMGKRISQVELNGSSVAFTIKDGYVCFDGDGSPKPSNPFKEEATPSVKPSGGGSSGSGGGSHGKNTQTIQQPSGPVVTPPKPTEPAPVEDLILKELDGHWAEDEIKQLYEQGVVKGVSSVSFGLKQDITRAEFIALLVRMMGYETQPYSGSFRDVSGEEWYADSIETAYHQGLIQGFDNMASPQAHITRQETAQILSNLLQSEARSQLEFTDAEQIAGWARTAVEQVVALELMQGYPDGRFDPEGTTLREQAFAIIYRLGRLTAQA